MAKQRGVIKLEGLMDDISFVKTSDGFLARRKGGVSASRIANDPNFQRTRENGAEFGRAGSAGKLLRKALKNSLKHISDRRMSLRLTRLMMRIIHSDTQSLRGLRNPSMGDKQLLNGFEFNKEASFSNVYEGDCDISLNRTTGVLTVTFPPYETELAIDAPTGCTHYRLVAGAAALDFTAGSYQAVHEQGELLALSLAETEELKLTCHLPANSTDPVIVAAGILFYQSVGAGQFALKSASGNAMSIVGVDVV